MHKAAICLAAMTTACAATIAPPPASDPAQRCRADGLSQFVGQAATSAVGADMLRASGARLIRWVAHGAVVTMEFNPARVTVQLDPANRIVSANCG